jgi:uncharacterized protein (DUF924 family)
VTASILSPSVADVSPEDVLEFWFGIAPADERGLMEKVRRWFHGGDALDREVVAGFADAVDAALGGRLDAWRSSPRGRLALVILLDQFTRSVFRGTPRVYAGDARAQQLVLEAFADGSAEELPFVEQLFLSLPLLHAESLVLQDREAQIATALAAKAPPLWKPMSAMHLEQSAKYRRVIERFGRFPHRNAILGRSSTPEEIEFLADWEAKAPPAGARFDR